jgi:HlyD family secretion protein
MARSAAFLGVVGILAAALTIANLNRDPDSVSVDWRIVKQPPIEVRVEAPSRGLIARRITAPGVVEAIDEAKIGPQILGRVVAVNVSEGNIVKAGDVLVKLDDTDARSRVLSSQARSDRLRAAINQAESELAQANREEVQYSRLAGRGFATPKELADARTHLAKSEAALEMSRREFTESEALRRISFEELNRTAIKAPIDGVVTGVSVRVGEVVIAGTMNLPGSVLMTISDIAHMRVSADVDESDVPSIIPGHPARIYLQAEEQPPIPATVERIASRGRKTGDVVSFETRVRVDHPPPALRAAMTATVEIDVRRIDNALGVPVQAVVHRRRKELPDTAAVRAWAERHARSPGENARDAASRYIKVVFVVEGGVARSRPVETGISDERRVEIVSGLAGDDRVIVGPFRALDQIRDDQVVRVEVETPAE